MSDFDHSSTTSRRDSDHKNETNVKDSIQRYENEYAKYMESIRKSNTSYGTNLSSEVEYESYRASKMILTKEKEDFERELENVRKEADAEKMSQMEEKLKKLEEQLASVEYIKDYGEKMVLNNIEQQRKIQEGQIKRSSSKKGIFSKKRKNRSDSSNTLPKLSEVPLSGRNSVELRNHTFFNEINQIQSTTTTSSDDKRPDQPQIDDITTVQTTIDLEFKDKVKKEANSTVHTSSKSINVKTKDEQGKSSDTPRAFPPQPTTISTTKAINNKPVSRVQTSRNRKNRLSMAIMGTQAKDYNQAITTNSSPLNLNFVKSSPHGANGTNDNNVENGSKSIALSSKVMSVHVDVRHCNSNILKTDEHLQSFVEEYKSHQLTITDRISEIEMKLSELTEYVKLNTVKAVFGEEEGEDISSYDEEVKKETHKSIANEAMFYKKIHDIQKMLEALNLQPHQYQGDDKSLSTIVKGMNELKHTCSELNRQVFNDNTTMTTLIHNVSDMSKMMETINRLCCIIDDNMKKISSNVDKNVKMTMSTLQSQTTAAVNVSTSNDLQSLDNSVLIEIITKMDMKMQLMSEKIDTMERIALQEQALQAEHRTTTFRYLNAITEFLATDSDDEEEYEES